MGMKAMMELIKLPRRGQHPASSPERTSDSRSRQTVLGELAELLPLVVRDAVSEELLIRHELDDADAGEDLLQEA